MEISRYSQGGQQTFDNSNLSNNSNQVANSPQPTQVATVSTVQDQNQTQDQSRNNKVDEKELRKAVDRLNRFVEADNIKVTYDVHPQFGDLMIKITDKSTGNVISELPPRKILDMVAKMCELAGVIFDRKA